MTNKTLGGAASLRGRAGTSALAMALMLAGGAAMAQDETYLGRIIFGYTEDGQPIYAADNSSTLEGNALSAQGGVARLDEVLRQVPGTTTLLNPGQPGVVVAVRGLGGSNIETTIEGVPQNFRFTAHNNADGFTYVDPLMLSSIDITRGASVTQGGLMGSVNFGLLSAEDVVDGEGTGGLLRLTYSDNGEGFSGLAGVGTVRGPLSLGAFISSRDIAAYVNGEDTEIPNTDQDAQSWLVRGAYDVNDALSLSFLSLSHEGAYSSEQAGFAPGSTIWYDMEVTNRINQIGLEYSNGDAVNLTAQIYTGTTEHTHVDGNGSAVISGGVRRPRQMTTETLGINLSNESRFTWDRWEIVSTNGFSLLQDDLSGQTGGSNPTEGEASRTVFFSENVLTSGPLELMLGLRASDYALSWDSPSGLIEVNHDSVDPKVSVAYQVNDWLQPYVSYARTTRAPTAQEAFLGGANNAQHGGFGSFNGNANLEPEITEGWEAGANISRNDIWSQGDRLSARIAYFDHEIENFIYLETGPTRFENMDAPLDNSGLELELSYESERFSGVLSWTRSEGDFYRSSFAYNPITHVVTETVVGGRIQPQNALSATLATHLMDGALTLGTTYTYNSNGPAMTQFAGADAEGRDSYQIWDLFASYEISENISVNAKVSNVADELYTPWASTTDTGVGRNIYVGAEFRF